MRHIALLRGVNLGARNRVGMPDLLRERFGVDAGVVVRDEAQLRAIAADDPLAGVATDGSRRFVAFLSQPHDPAALPEVSGPERLVARPTELHVWCPDGLRGSRLMTQLARRPPAPVVTVRNWNTVTRLAAMLDAPGGS